MSSVSGADGGYSYYNKKIGDLEEDYETEKKRARERQEAKSTSLEKNYKHTIEKQERDSHDTAERIRSQAHDQVETTRKQAREDVAEAKAQLYTRNGKVAEEVGFERKRADQAINQARQEADHMIAKERKAGRTSSDKIAWQAKQTAVEDAAAQRQSNIRMSEELNNKVKSLLEAERMPAREKANASAQVRREIEDDLRLKEHMLNDQFTADSNKLKRDNEDTARVYGQRMAEVVKEKDQKTADIVGRQTKESYQREKDLTASFDRGYAQQELLAKKQAENAERALESQGTRMAEDRREALAQQAEANRNAAIWQKNADNEKISQLQKRVYQQMNNEDGLYISPAVQNAMENAISGEYEKKHQANVDRMDRRSDNIKTDYEQRLADSYENNQTREKDLSRQFASQAHQDQSVFLHHMDETERTHQAIIRNKDYESAHQANTLSQNHARQMEQQRRDYEDLLEQTHSNAQERTTSLRQDAQFQAKMAQRDFASKTNELTRNYDKKLAEQKTNYEDVIDNLKIENARIHRDEEHRAQRLLEDQAKGYDQRISTMEFQSKERERIIADNYQDQIDKLKRTNALLAQKKS